MLKPNKKLNSIVAGLEELGLYAAIFLVPAILWAA